MPVFVSISAFVPTYVYQTPFQISLMKPLLYKVIMFPKLLKILLFYIIFRDWYFPLLVIPEMLACKFSRSYIKEALIFSFPLISSEAHFFYYF